MKRKELADSTVSPGWAIAGRPDPIGVKRETAGLRLGCLLLFESLHRSSPKPDLA